MQASRIHPLLFAAITLALVLAAGPLAAQGEQRAVEFRFGDQTVDVPRVGAQVELLPVLRLIGAEVAFSSAAGTYGVVHGDHFIQFSPDRLLVLVDGVLQEGSERPITSPGGVAASFEFLEQTLLASLGFRLEPTPSGFAIVPGESREQQVAVQVAAADFAATTTLVCTVARRVEVRVLVNQEHELGVHFVDALPRLDSSVPLRSRRVTALRARDHVLTIELASGVDLLSWHQLDDPSRIILELGTPRPTPAAAPEEPFEQDVVQPIVIDPGHGGDDTGAVAASGLAEKELTLDIARRLAQVLRGMGLTVRLTRTDDEARALTDRTAFANRLAARAFVSLHANSSTVAAVRGAETYYMSLDRSSTDAAAAATADLENQADTQAQERSPLDLILWDMAQSEVLNESAGLALAVQDRLNTRLDLRDRGVKQAPFAVLTGATMPAVLVEVGFLSNPDEATMLRDPSHQQGVAEAIAQGVADFVRPP